MLNRGVPVPVETLGLATDICKATVLGKTCTLGAGCPELGLGTIYLAAVTVLSSLQDHRFRVCLLSLSINLPSEGGLCPVPGVARVPISLPVIDDTSPALAVTIVTEPEGRGVIACIRLV